MIKSIVLQGYEDIRVRANPIRKLSCDGASRGFESDTVPFIIIFGTSVRLTDDDSGVFFPGAVKDGSTAAPVAAPIITDRCKKFLRLIVFFLDVFMI